MNLEGVEILFVIQSRIAQYWLRKLRYEYKDVCKNVFVDGHKRSDVIEDGKNFLQKMKEIKSYIVEFEENGAIKSQIYLSDYAAEGND